MGESGQNRDAIKSKISPHDIESFLQLFGNDTGAAVEAITEFAKQDAKSLYPAARRKDGMVIVSAHEVSKSYRVDRQNLEVLRRVSLDIRKGELVALTGPSGSGKSTLLHILGCIDVPSSGRVLIEGQDTSLLRDRALSRLRQEKIGFVFQSFYLQPFLRLEDNVAVPAVFTRTKKTLIDQETVALLERVGLAEYAKHLPKELSGGQIQRAAIARALINNPSIVIADEPTGNLDSKNSQSIIDLFKTLRDTLGTTIIIATHNQDIALQADRIIVVQDGVIA